MMRRSYEKLILKVVCTLSISFFILLLYNEVIYLKILSLHFKSESIGDFTLHLGIESSDQSFLNSVSMITTSGKISDNLSKRYRSATTSAIISKDTEKIFTDLHRFSIYNPSYKFYTEYLPSILLPLENPNLADIWNFTITKDLPNWKMFHYQISKYFLYEDSPLIEALLEDIATQKIIAVDQHPGGTQLKFIIHFEDGGRALFKPMRFARDVEAGNNILYMIDYERHVSEIAGFHLDRILGFRRVPPVVGRKINITTELFPFIKDSNIKETFYVSSDGRHCFYGNCRLYCKKRYSFCGNPSMIEGSFSAYLPPFPYELLSQRLVSNPWKRTYLPGLKAEWEMNPNYCNDFVKHLKLFKSSRRLYDVIDCAIFDFLIGNEDRHDYDEFNVFGKDRTNTIIHLDNGRGFARSYHDEESIIAPLIQCCLIRLSTFNKLYSFYIGSRSLSDLMKESLYRDPVAPVLTELHLQALDRRVAILLQVIHRCIKNNSSYKVFLNDITM